MIQSIPDPYSPTTPTSASLPLTLLSTVSYTVCLLLEQSLLLRGNFYLIPTNLAPSLSYQVYDSDLGSYFLSSSFHFRVLASYMILCYYFSTVLLISQIYLRTLSPRYSQPSQNPTPILNPTSILKYLSFKKIFKLAYMVSFYSYKEN